MKKSNRKSIIEDIAIGTVNLRFHSLAGYIGRIVVNGSPPLRRFFEAVLPRR